MANRPAKLSTDVSIAYISNFQRKSGQLSHMYLQHNEVTAQFVSNKSYCHSSIINDTGSKIKLGYIQKYTKAIHYLPNDLPSV